MSTLQRPRSGPCRVSPLMRLVALYVAGLLAWQGLAAAIALGQGPLHQHRVDGAAAVAAFFQHGKDHGTGSAYAHGHAHGHTHAHAHAHAHAEGQRHAHDPTDASVVPMATAAGEAADALAFALTCAMALLAVGSTWAAGRGATGAVLCGHRPWAIKPAPNRLLFRPPRSA
ncbi:MAG: hypothetical protein LH480_04645 [Rubrivivax sp.]|nr:hypothetical protein [Rubrivivax sp.]